MNKKLKQQRAAQQRAKLKKKEYKRRGLPVPTSLMLGFAAAIALLGGIEVTDDEPEPGAELPPPTDDLTLNPKTYTYE
jgi:hypothetical protein